MGKKKSFDYAGQLFAKACEFHSAAAALASHSERRKVSSHWNNVIYYNYFHSLECALKTFHRIRTGYINRDHNLKKLVEFALSSGLKVTTSEAQDLLNIVSLLEGGNKDHGFRYSMKSTAVPDAEWAGRIIGILIEVVRLEVTDATPEQLGKGRPSVQIVVCAPSMSPSEMNELIDKQSFLVKAINRKKDSV